MSTLEQTEITNPDYFLTVDNTRSSDENKVPDVFYAKVSELNASKNQFDYIFIPVMQGSVSMKTSVDVGSFDVDKTIPTKEIQYPEFHFDETSLKSLKQARLKNWNQTVLKKERSLKNIFLPKSKKNQLLTQIIHRFNRKVELYPEFNKGLKIDKVEPVVEDLAVELIKNNFEEISITPTEEKSISLKLTHNDFTIYFEYFLELLDASQELEGDDDQVIINVFKNKQIISNWGGNYWESLHYIKKLVNQ